MIYSLYIRMVKLIENIVRIFFSKIKKFKKDYNVETNYSNVIKEKK